MRYLAILLLAPWLLILGWAYWAGSNRICSKGLPRTTPQRWFDALALLFAAALSVWLADSAFNAVTVAPVGDFGPPSGAIWKQVVPALYGYGAFVAVLAVALLLRWRFWRRRA
jgi:hypothetical protein